MSTILTIIGDPHAKPDNLDRIKGCLDIAEREGNAVIWMGDMLDTKEIIRGKALSTWYNGFKESKLYHVILTGNHDYFNNECQEHSLELLKELPNVTVVDKPTVLFDCTFLPFYANLDAFREAAKQATTDVLFMHQGVNGFDYGNGFIADREAHLEDLAHFKLVISGHFHKYQRKDNVIYIGTPFSHSFGEANQDKFYGIFDQSKLELITYDTGFPKHMSLEVDAANPDFSQIDSANQWRVVLKGTAEDIEKLKAVKSTMPNVKFIDRVESSFTSASIDETETNETKFLKWAKEIKGLDQDTIDLGLEILRHV